MAETQTTESTPVTNPVASTAPSATPESASAQPVEQATPASAQPETTPKDSQVSSLTTEDFDHYKTRVDRNYQQLNSQFAQAWQQLEAQRIENETLRLANADDGERASYYANQVRQLRDQQAQVQRQQAEYTFWNNTAYSMIVESGLTADDPDLKPHLAGGATPDGIRQLATGIAKISMQRLKEARAEAEKAFKRGGIDALNEAGVTATSNGTGAGAAASAESAAVKAYETERARLNERRLKGRAPSNAEYAELRKLAAAAGM